MEVKQYRTNAIIDNEIEGLMMKQFRFEKLKVGDVVKVPPYGKKVKIIEKYPHHFVARHRNGYKVGYSKGDYIVALGLSGRIPERREDPWN